MAVDPFTADGTATVTNTGGNCVFRDVSASAETNTDAEVANRSGGFVPVSNSITFDLVGTFAGPVYEGTIVDSNAAGDPIVVGEVTVTNGVLNAVVEFVGSNGSILTHSTHLGNGRCGSFCFSASSSWLSEGVNG